MTNQNPPHGDRRPVAYLNDRFLNSPDARALRILSEFLEPLAHFRREKIRDTVVFFGSARIREDGPMSRYYQDARTLARMLTEWSGQFDANLIVPVSEVVGVTRRGEVINLVDSAVVGKEQEAFFRN